MSNLSDTLSLMRQLHSNQKDCSGHPYEYHPQRVAGNLQMLFPDTSEDVLMAALLHDVIEDCGISPEELRDLGYSEECIQMILIVSKPEDDKRSYKQVITDIIQTRNIGAILIKIADNVDNSHPQRVKELSDTNPERSSKLIERYNRSITCLCEAIGFNPKVVFEFIKASPPLDTYQYPEGRLFIENR